jgi:nitroreductase
MELEQVIAERKSIRAFKKDPLPRGLIEEVFNQVIQAPSALNLQPWEFIVVSGEEKERLSRLLLKSYQERKISCSPGAKGPLPAELSARGEQSIEALKPALDELGLSFDAFINEGSCRFYGAPVAIICCMNKVFSPRQYLCIGVALGYLALAAHARGLGTCPIGLIAAYEDQVREFLNIPGDREIIIGVALGYPDWSSPINRSKTPRAPLGKVFRWFD